MTIFISGAARYMEKWQLIRCHARLKKTIIKDITNE
jgi:hypothetical protein